MTEWIVENRAVASVLSAVITTLAGLVAMLWIVWQVQYQITDSISASEVRLETRLRAEIAQFKDDLSGDISGLKDDLSGDISEVRNDLSGDISGLRADLSKVEDKLDTLQESLDARLDQVELEQAEQRGMISGMQR